MFDNSCDYKASTSYSFYLVESDGKYYYGVDCSGTYLYTDGILKAMHLTKTGAISITELIGGNRVRYDAVFTISEGDD